ncbi:MFS transporter [Nocardioides sp. AX2bis]|uniref:MFS transporter n=1 Tax=Nocardioides sp. AX2bis TaxID=2653157 RepID=UPI0012F15E66|nr:MFS transporter [Nocardioides sp. AX2bis]VXC48274.1 MFS transporter [Nocardioides sp. AX2bis]
MSHTSPRTERAVQGPGRPDPAPDNADHHARLPVAALLVMAFMGFLLITTETMPAGLLAQIATGMSTSEGVAGQFSGVFALGTIVAAIPAVTLTRGLRRKPVFVVGGLGLLAANVVTTFSDAIALSLAARLVGGAFAGLLWGMTAGYARRITAPQHTGRALAIASLGVPTGLAVGTPFGSWLGSTFDWRWSFGTLAILTAVAVLLVVALVPDAPGQEAETQAGLNQVLRLPGVAAILAVIVAWMLAHNISYTYISSYLASGDLGISVDVALVVFGVAAIGGIALSGAVIDRALRPLVLGSITSFVLAGGLLVVGRGSTVVVLVAIVIWGLAFGGAAAQLQTAISIAAGDNADVANSMLGVAFNVAIFAAAVIGAVLIGTFDPVALPVVMVALALAALSLTHAARRSAIPVRP